VLDASFRTRAMRAAARSLAGRHGVPFRFVECRVPQATCRARLERREREGGVSDGRLAIFDDFCKKVEPTTELDAGEHVVVDTSGTAEQSLGQVERVVATWPERLR
jgi:predicted kinase